MKSIIVGFVVFFCVSVTNAQPWRDGQGPPRERRMDAKDFGDVDRLERAGPPHQMGQNRGEFRPQKQFRPQPNFGMNSWGGDPHRGFTSGRPWGTVDSGVRGPRPDSFPFNDGFWGPRQLRGGGPQGKISGDSMGNNGGKGRQHHGYKYRGEKPYEKQERRGDNKICPFCGIKMS